MSDFKRKLHNTQALIDFLEQTFTQMGLKPGTRAGAGFSIYCMAILDQAETEGIDVARRNLDNQIAMLRGMRDAVNAEQMAIAAETSTAETFERERKRT